MVFHTMATLAGGKMADGQIEPGLVGTPRA